MDPVERRSILKTVPNPNNDHDYLIELEDKIHPIRLVIEDEVTICLRYIPDSCILVPAEYGNYLAGFEDEKFSDTGIEEIAGMILDDLNNEIVPCWINLDISVAREGVKHRVVLEDRQPDWSNEALIARFKNI